MVMRARCAPLGPAGGNKKDTQEFQRTESRIPDIIIRRAVFTMNAFGAKIDRSASRIKALLYTKLSPG